MTRSAIELTALRYRAHDNGLIPIDVIRALSYEERQRVMLMTGPLARRELGISVADGEMDP